MMLKKPTVFVNSIAYLSIILIVGIYYSVCYSNSYNFFFQDDYHLLSFVNTAYNPLLTFTEKLQALWSLHNEHRIVFPRLFVLIDCYLQGHIDWKVLNTVATLYYLGIFIIFSLFIKRLKLSIIYVVPIAFIIFQPASTDNYLWTISTLQQVGNIFWAMLLFYSVCFFSPKYFWISIILVLVLTFTHGNGLFSFPVVALILLFQKRFKQLIIWICLMIFVAMIYFWGYQNGQNSNLAGSLSDPTRLALCFGGFWGSFVSIISHRLETYYQAITLGFIVFVTLLFFNLRLTYHETLTLFNKKHSTIQAKESSVNGHFLLAYFIFFTITALLVTLSRSWSGLESSFANRYLHNSFILFVLFYCTLLYYLPTFKRSIVGSFLILGIVFNAFSWYQNFDRIIYIKYLNQAEAFNYQHDKITVENAASFNRNIRDVLAQSFQNGVSVFPDNFLQPSIFNAANQIPDFSSQYNLVISKDSLLMLDAKESHYLPRVMLKNTTLPYDGQAFVVFKSSKNTYIYPVLHQKSGRRRFMQLEPYFTKGFSTSVLLDSFEKNTYQIGIIQKINNQLVCHFTPQSINVR
ncbi:hypothetical protein VB264_03805 [Arcicella aquatica]|uniref:Uncharacterized protein n=1 Tax=Arcicella aquatica TaxID=217141 RepID=A0ABU5QIZ3_9BACT|nr:hypothetical protein [Arcicella aquatica]MEA5256895.1 hypothetical protein [Arcicella aquatica]